MGSSRAHATHVEPAAYAGEVTPPEAWERLKREKDAVLVDVRTPPEWAFSGEPDLSALDKEPLRLSWKFFPSYALNAQFVDSLKGLGLKSDAPLLFLCRTGGRSLDAACAATAEGFTRCYNITDGFEGMPNEHHQRGALTGWKASGLPWIQS